MAAPTSMNQPGSNGLIPEPSSGNTALKPAPQNPYLSFSTPSQWGDAKMTPDQMMALATAARSGGGTGMNGAIGNAIGQLFPPRAPGSYLQAPPGGAPGNPSAPQQPPAAPPGGGRSYTPNYFQQQGMPQPPAPPMSPNMHPTGATNGGPIRPPMAPPGAAPGGAPMPPQVQTPQMPPPQMSQGVTAPPGAGAPPMAAAQTGPVNAKQQMAMAQLLRQRGGIR